MTSQFEETEIKKVSTELLVNYLHYKGFHAEEDEGGILHVWKGKLLPFFMHFSKRKNLIGIWSIIDVNNDVDEFRLSRFVNKVNSKSNYSRSAYRFSVKKGHRFTIDSVIQTNFGLQFKYIDISIMNFHKELDKIIYSKGTKEFFHFKKNKISRLGPDRLKLLKQEKQLNI